LANSLANFDNFCEIDPSLKDAWGIPALRISMAHGKNEAAMMRDAGGAAAEMLESCRRKKYPPHHGVEMPGMAIHEVRNGAHGGRSEEIRAQPLLPVARCRQPARGGMDLVLFSSACQNPTLTMMAISVRACDHPSSVFDATTSKTGTNMRAT